MVCVSNQTIDFTQLNYNARQRSYSLPSQSLLALFICATGFSCEKYNDKNNQDSVDSTSAVQTYLRPADELSVLEAGAGAAQVSAYSNKAVDFTDQSVYFINLDTRSLTVTIE